VASGKFNATNQTATAPSIELRGATLEVSPQSRSLKGWLSGTRPVGPPVRLLDNADFSAQTGDRIGVLGFNGMGKTTFLRVIAGIYPLTAGIRRVNGLITPIMTTGLGLDPELTVRANLKLGLAYTGQFSAFDAALEEKILDFAELSDDRDKLFKHLSSGFRSRLGFAIAICKPASILLLDEVFATGDLAFVEKAKGAMRHEIESAAITLLVSNSPRDISDICNRALIIEHGRIVMDAGVEEVCEEYRQRVQARRNAKARAGKRW
jgi:lipopolysaccharide transport system ATP-binding protein